MTYVFTSNFKDYIKGLIEQKHALGYTYEKDQWYLKNFDQFCTTRFPQETILSKGVCMEWAKLRQAEGAGGLRRRIAPIRELAKYMNCIGLQAYSIPPDIVRKPARYVPHIFTEEELAAFYAAADKFEYDRRSPARHLVIPVIFRVIYCCALRPSEALNLKVSDVDPEVGRIDIKESKGHKDRIVMLSKDISELCRRYYERVHCIFPQGEYFFPNHQGGAYSPSQLYRLFWHCWDMSGIKDFHGPAPRVYDFRHSAATNCLYRWMKEGRDLNALLPYLSEYLGHAGFAETAYYIHLVPEFFPQMAQMDMNKFSGLIPEVEP